MEDSLVNSRRRERRSGLVFVCVSLAVMSIEARAQDAGGDEGNHPSATSNQSISIEPAPDEEAAGLSARSTEVAPGVRGTDSSVSGGEPSAAVMESKPVRSGARGVRGTGTGGLTSGVSVSESKPWYRTGIGALAVVLGLIGGLYFAARRWLPTARVSDDGAMRVVGRAGLGPRQHLALVRIGRRMVVVGVSPDRVEAVCEITDDEEVAELAVQAGAAGSSRFAKWLDREASDYARTATLGDSVEGGSTRSMSGATNPARELLHRLRRLQSSS